MSTTDLASQFLRAASVVSDQFGVDPLLDKSVAFLSNISIYSNHTVRPDERGAPDLISFREYGTEDLWWVILAYNGIGSYTDILEGLILRIPDRASVTSTLSRNSTKNTRIQRVITI